MAKPRNDPPFILILKRKVIRVFPDGTKVAMYWNDKLKTSFAVPFKPESVGISGAKNIYQNLPEGTIYALEEGAMGAISHIAKGEGKGNVQFSDGSSSVVDPFTAQAIKKVLSSMSLNNQKKYQDMLNKSSSSFSTAMTFALKHAQAQ